MIAFLFPGQGSQMLGMGSQLFDEFPDMVATADHILGYSVKTLCLEDPHKQLNMTEYTQPALYIVNALFYLKKIQQQKPDYVAGHSLGEYSALFAAEVFDFATGLKLVKKRGELMSQAKGGGMAAIVGVKLNDIQQILEKNNFSNLTIANFNSYLQYVISGTKQDIDHAQIIFNQLYPNSFIPLKVSGAFHSNLMLSAQQQFADFLNDFNFAMPVIPVLANVNAMPYHPAVIKTNLATQITQSVQWIKIIEYLLKHDDISLEEIGPGTVLSGLVWRMKNGQ